MDLALAPAKLVSFGMAVVVELHAERLVDGATEPSTWTRRLPASASITLSLHDFAQSSTASTSLGSAPNIEASSVLDR
jgi:hypothetical protein